MSVRPRAGESSGTCLVLSSGLDRRVQCTDELESMDRNLAIVALSFLWTFLNRDWWKADVNLRSYCSQGVFTVLVASGTHPDDCCVNVKFSLLLFCGRWTR